MYKHWTKSKSKPPADLTHHFGTKAKELGPSLVKDFYNYVEIPNIVNAATGLSVSHLLDLGVGDTGLSPKEDKSLELALQYVNIGHHPDLIDWVRQFVQEYLVHAPYDGGVDVILSCGNTDALGKVLQLFSDEWIESRDSHESRRAVLIDEFSHPTSVQAITARGIQVVPVDIDHHGLVPDKLDQILGSWDYSKGKRPHLLYTTSIGQNPTGTVVSMDRKSQIYAICQRYDVVIIEDEPYWFLQFDSAKGDDIEGKEDKHHEKYHDKESTQDWSGLAKTFFDSLVPGYISLDSDGRVIRLETFANCFGPGARLGYIVAQPKVVEKLVRLTELSTESPSGLAQAVVTRFLHQLSARLVFQGSHHGAPVSHDSESPQLTLQSWILHLKSLREYYQSRMTIMCKALDHGNAAISFLPNCDDWNLVRKTTIYEFEWPKAGMYVWIKVHLLEHPLAPMFNAPDLGHALFLWLTRKPALLLCCPGSMFSPTKRVAKYGSLYFRLCYSGGDQVKESADRFVQGVQSFWGIDNAQVIHDLLQEYNVSGTFAMAYASPCI